MRISARNVFDVQRFYDVAEMKRRLVAHLHWYNHSRTHHAVGGLLVPADRYYGRVEEVLARIEAGAGRDAKDFVGLRERCLELFKVTSIGGGCWGRSYWGALRLHSGNLEAGKRLRREAASVCVN